MRDPLPVLVVFLCLLPAVAVGADAPPEPEAVLARVDADGVQRAAIVGGNYFFKPKHLVLKAPEAGIELDRTLRTDPEKVFFTPTAIGSYPFYCRNRLLFFKSHREQGMEGVLEVVP